MNALTGKNGGFLMMVMAILGVVLYVTMFSNVLDAFDALAAFTNASQYIAFSTVVTIAPTILFLAGIFGAGVLYYKGYKKAVGSGVNAMLIVVLGCLEIILFVTLFSTIMTAMEILRTWSTVANYIAFSTVVTIAPTILFLSGIFAGGATAIGGYKNYKKGKKGAAAS